MGRGEDNIITELKKRKGGHGLDSFSSGQGHVFGCCEHSKEPLGSINKSCSLASQGVM